MSARVLKRLCCSPTNELPAYALNDALLDALRAFLSAGPAPFSKIEQSIPFFISKLTVFFWADFG